MTVGTLVVDLQGASFAAYLNHEGGACTHLPLVRAADERLLIRLALCPIGSMPQAVAGSIYLDDPALPPPPLTRIDQVRATVRAWQASGPVPIDLTDEQLVIDRTRVDVRLPDTQRQPAPSFHPPADRTGGIDVFGMFYAHALSKAMQAGRLEAGRMRDLPIENNRLMIIARSPNMGMLSDHERRLVMAFLTPMLEALRSDPTFQVVQSTDFYTDGPHMDGVYLLEPIAERSHAGVHLHLRLRDGISRETPWWATQVLTEPSGRPADISPALITAGHIASALLKARMAANVSAPGLLDRWIRWEARINAFQGAGADLIEAEIVAILRQAPNFVRALTSYANFKNSIHFMVHGLWRDDLRSADAYRLSSQAVALEPRFARNHLALAHSCMMTRRHPDAIRHFFVAYDLSPVDVRTLVSSACGLAVSGEARDGAQMMARARQFITTPTPSQEHYAGLVYLLDDQLDEAVQHFTYAGAFPIAAAFLAAALGLRGATVAARKSWATAVERAAQRWSRPGPILEAEIAAWYLHLVPFARQRDWERLRDGLREAGAPVDHCRFQEW